jgi:UDP-3-O-[3-hydroxymyristoyl] glucosamine N-acyltransferase
VQTTLGELAARFSLQLHGDPATVVVGMCSLQPGEPGKLAFLADAKYETGLAGTHAAAVVLRPELVARCPVYSLSSANPHLAFSRIAALWDARSAVEPGIHPTAVILEGARIASDVSIGPGCVVGRNVVIGAGSRLAANVTLVEGVCIGARVRIEPGAVIGGRGFGLVRDGERWVEVPQLGSVRVGDDVEIGANTTIDRGAIEDTVIEEGVKIDSHVHIAHNCRIGAHTVIAGCVGISGSVTIGRRCILAGGVGVADHVSIADDVVVSGMSMVTRNIDEPGMYSAGWGAQPASEWRRQVAALRRLPEWMKKGGKK